VVLLAACVWLLVRLVNPRPIVLIRSLAVGAAALIVLVVVAVVVPAGPAPAQPLTWSGTTLGGPWQTGSSRLRTAPLALANLGKGTYRVTVVETVNSATGRSSRLSVLTTPVQHVLVSNWFNLGHPTSMASMVVGIPPLDVAQEHVATLALPPTTSTRQTTVEFSTAAASVFSISVGVSAHSTLDVTSVQLEKTAN
jgi:hypothetical protein